MTDEPSVHVLVLEDDAQDRILLERAVSSIPTPIAFRHVGTRASFEDAVDTESWDVILTDYMLPGYSGIAAVEAIKTRQLDTPLIIVSGRIGEETAVEAMRAGAADYVMKDNLSRLAPAIERELHQAQRRAEQREAERAANRALAARTEELERSNRELEEFAYVASHDLSAPLHIVGGYVDLLARRYQDQLDAGAEDLLAGAVRGVTRMQALIDSLLYYSRAGRHPLTLSRADVNAIVAEILQELEPQIKAANAAVAVHALPVVTADATLLEQVFKNLVENALKFVGEDEPHIEISGEEFADEWRFAVADNGIGVDPDQAEEIFRMFGRGSGNRFPGCGIGLATCRRVVQRHGGRIWCEPAQPHGSTFRFALPKQQADGIS